MDERPVLVESLVEEVIELPVDDSLLDAEISALDDPILLDPSKLLALEMSLLDILDMLVLWETLALPEVLESPELGIPDLVDMTADETLGDMLPSLEKPVVEDSDRVDLIEAAEELPLPMPVLLDCDAWPLEIETLADVLEAPTVDVDSDLLETPETRSLEVVPEGPALDVLTIEDIAPLDERDGAMLEPLVFVDIAETLVERPEGPTLEDATLVEEAPDELTPDDIFVEAPEGPTFEDPDPEVTLDETAPEDAACVEVPETTELDPPALVEVAEILPPTDVLSLLDMLDEPETGLVVLLDTPEAEDEIPALLEETIPLAVEDALSLRDVTDVIPLDDAPLVEAEAATLDVLDLLEERFVDMPRDPELEAVLLDSPDDTPLADCVVCGATDADEVAVFEVCDEACTELVG